MLVYGRSLTHLYLVRKLCLLCRSLLKKAISFSRSIVLLFLHPFGHAHSKEKQQLVWDEIVLLNVHS